MRQRYYNPEIKRFVNQDILTGSIGNSQSLNRYSYVQGNPVSYTDPFGLSPLNGLFSGMMFVHTVCGLLGWIPGPVGAIANAVDGLVYLLVDKDYKNAFFALGSAVTFGAGKIVAAVGKGSKTALNIQRTCNFAGSAINFAQSADGTYQTASMMADKYIVQGQPFSGSTVLEVGLLAANIFGTYKSGSYVLNDLADVGNSVTRSFKAWRNGNAGQTSYGKSSGNLNWDAIVSKKGETRVEHINRHALPNNARETHGVFNGNPIDMVNDAWGQRHLVEPISDGMGGTIYNIPYKNAGYESGYVNTGAQMDYITIVTMEGNADLITAFPSFGDYHK